MMIGSLFAAIGSAAARRAQFTSQFGNGTPTPGSHSHLHNGVTPAAASIAFAATLVAAFPIGRAGRSGSAAAWPGARSNPSRRVAPRKGAGE